MRSETRDLVRIRDAGFEVEFVATRCGPGWVLLDPDGSPLMIGDHGCVAPRKMDAVAEGMKRVEEDY